MLLFLILLVKAGILYPPIQNLPAPRAARLAAIEKAEDFRAPDGTQLRPVGVENVNVKPPLNRAKLGSKLAFLKVVLLGEPFEGLESLLVGGLAFRPFFWLLPVLGMRVSGILDAESAAEELPEYRRDLTRLHISSLYYLFGGDSSLLKRNKVDCAAFHEKQGSTVP